MIAKGLRPIQQSVLSDRRLWGATALAALAMVAMMALAVMAIERPMALTLLPAIAALVLISRRYGLLAVLVLLVGFPEMQVPGIPFDVPILMPVVLLLFFLHTMKSGKLNAGGAGAPFIAFVAAMAISWMWSEAVGLLPLAQLAEFEDSNIHLSTYRITWQIGAWVLGFGVFLSAVNLLKSMADIYRLARYLIIVGLLVAAYGYYEILAMKFSLPYIFPAVPDWDFLPNAKISFGGILFPRIYSSFQEPKLLGHFLLIPLFLSGSVWTVLRRRRYIYYCAFILGALLLTFSTTAWLGAIVGFIVWLYFLRRKYRHMALRYIAGSVMLLAGLWLVASLFIDGLITSGLTFLSLHPARMVGIFNNPSFVSADYLNGWNLGWTLFISSPLFGVGIGNSPFYSGITEFVFTPFNLLLLLLAETGMLGLLAFLVLLGLILVRSWQAIRIPQNIVERPLAVALMAGAIAAFIGGFITYLAFGGARFYMEDWVLLALMTRGG